MPKGISLGPGVGHEYDPNLFFNSSIRTKAKTAANNNEQAPTNGNEVFHNHSSNIPHLKNWIDQLVALTISSDNNSLKQAATADGGVQHPTTENLVQALQRYDAVYQELMRQVGIFSEPLSKMMSKAWKGVFCLMNFMIKAYHRYVKHTSDLQSQAQSLLNERQKDDAAGKIKAEESELERIHLRAKIRTLEAELESMKMTKFGLERENDRMRNIIDVYINSSELQEPVFGLLAEDEISVMSVVSHDATGSMVDSVQEGDQPRRRANAADAGRMQLRYLNRLDVELNEILSGVLTEENRQRVLLRDLLHLFDRNRMLLERDPSEEAPDVSPVPVARSASTIKSPQSFSTHSAQSEFPSPSSVPSATGAGTGLGHSAQNRRSSIIPHFSENISKGVQADGKDDYSAVLDIDAPTAAAVNILGPPPLAPAVIKIRGSDYPYQVRRFMQSFPKVLRIPPAAWVCNQIMGIYLDKVDADREAEKKRISKQPMAEFTHVYFTKTTGLAASADVLTSQLFRACETQLKLPRVSVFAAQVGLIDKDHPPQLDVRDTEFILHFLRTLNEHHQEQLRIQAAALDVKTSSKRKGGGLAALLSKSAGGVLGSFGTSGDVIRAAAVSTVQEVFKKLLPDGGEDASMKVRAMPATEKGARFVDLDHVVQLSLEPWRAVRSNWEEHARFLFQRFCTVHRVISEVTFAGDDGTPASDTLIAEVLKEAADECGRRPLRLFQKTESVVEDKPVASKNSRKGAAAEAAAGIVQPTVSKEPVVEIMTRERFYSAVKLVNPYFTLFEMDSMFDEALDISHEDVLRNLEQLWVKCVEQPQATKARARADTDLSRSRHNSMHSVDELGSLGDVSPMLRAKPKHVLPPREYYVNTQNLLHTQWTKPYSQKIFRSQDIEIDAFVLVLIRRDILAKSPLLDKLHIAPKDIWPNADVLHKQIQDREKSKKDEASARKEREKLRTIRKSSPVSAKTSSPPQDRDSFKEDAEDRDDDLQSISEDLQESDLEAAKIEKGKEKDRSRRSRKITSPKTGTRPLPANSNNKIGGK